MHLSWHYTDRFGTQFGECPIGRSSTPRIGWQSFREEDGQLSYAARHSIAASNGRQGPSAPGSPLIHELSNPVLVLLSHPRGALHGQFPQFPQALRHFSCACVACCPSGAAGRLRATRVFAHHVAQKLAHRAMLDIVGLTGGWGPTTMGLGW